MLSCPTMREPRIRRRPRGRTPFSAVIFEGQFRLGEELRRRRFEASAIEHILETGYCLKDVVSPLTGLAEPCVCDGFYGSLWWRGRMPVDGFCASLISGRAEHAPRWNPPLYRVHSLAEAIDVVRHGRHAPYYESGRLCFRGQTQPYSTQRLVPNPYLADDRGSEQTIIAAFWRKYWRNWNRRPIWGYQSALFPAFTDRFVNYAVDVDALAKRHAAMGFTGIVSELQDSPFPEDREYHRRWWANHVAGADSQDYPLIEQHYGMSTTGLDVTFDLATAFFFAANRFTKKRGKADYQPIEGPHEGVVYCMVLPEGFRKTSDQVKSIPAFDHLNPLRPLRQQCALPSFAAHNFNEGVGHLDAILYLEPDCTLQGLPDKNWLFPDPSQDQLYGLLLQLRKEHPSYFREIVEYRF